MATSAARAFDHLEIHRPWSHQYAARLCDIAAFLHILSDHAHRDMTLVLTGPTAADPARLRFEAHVPEDRSAAKALTWAGRALLCPEDIPAGQHGPGELTNQLGGQQLSPHVEKVALETLARFWTESHPGEILPSAVLAVFSRQDLRREALVHLLVTQGPVTH